MQLPLLLLSLHFGRLLLAFFLVLLAYAGWRAWVVYRCVYGMAPCAVMSGNGRGDLNGKEYDFIIVGGGTAGCVLAARLSERKEATVLLLEAGARDDGPFFRLGLLGATFMNTPHHWNLFTQPEPELSRSSSPSPSKSEGEPDADGGRGRVLIQCRGKCLGGCSSLNLAIWHRGRPAEYNRWRDELGCAGWGYRELEPYFDRCEGRDSKARASGGYFDVNPQRFISAAGRLFEEACAKAMDLPSAGDFLLAPGRGVGRPMNMADRDGFRCNAVRAYLTRKGRDGVRVCDRPNLTVATEVHVSRISLDANQSADGVFFVRGRKHGFVSAKREVLLCAGTVHSPQLLMYSGIGPVEIKKMYVESRIDLPGVGQNLRDVASSGVIYRQKEASIDKLVKSKSAATKFLLGMTSPLHSNTMDSFAFSRLDGKAEAKSSLNGPEVMYSLQCTRFPFACVSSYTNTVEDGKKGGLPNAFTIHATLLKPKSRGTIKLGGLNPLSPPAISHNYLSEPDDMKSMIKAIKNARRIGNSSSFDGFKLEELLPGPSVKTDKDIEKYLRRSSCHFFGTLVGTCKMGPRDDPLAVVDTELKVIGAQRLRVIDASVMPTPISGFNHATVAAIAEKAADLIKLHHQFQ